MENEYTYKINPSFSNFVVPKWPSFHGGYQVSLREEVSGKDFLVKRNPWCLYHRYMGRSAPSPAPALVLREWT